MRDVEAGGWGERGPARGRHEEGVRTKDSDVSVLSVLVKPVSLHVKN